MNTCHGMLEDCFQEAKHYSNTSSPLCPAPHIQASTRRNIFHSDLCYIQQSDHCLEDLGFHTVQLKENQRVTFILYFHLFFPSKEIMMLTGAWPARWPGSAFLTHALETTGTRCGRGCRSRGTKSTVSSIDFFLVQPNAACCNQTNNSILYMCVNILSEIEFKMENCMNYCVPLHVGTGSLQLPSALHCVRALPDKL